MSEAIGMIENAMRADAEALRIIGQNVANAEVTAYRRQIPLNNLSFEHAVSAQTDLSATLANSRPAMAIDPRPGTLRATGQPFDVALEGNGFFALQSNSGQVLTRRGDFKVSAAGVLTSVTGLPVLGVGGPIHVGAGEPRIDSDGTVRVGTDIVGQLQLVQVADETKLQYLGEGLFVAPPDALLLEGGAQVRQGHLETSNVTPVGEMVQMMETLRHFEAAQRFVRGYDEMMEKAISELGKVG